MVVRGGWRVRVCLVVVGYCTAWRSFERWREDGISLPSLSRCVAMWTGWLGFGFMFWVADCWDDLVLSLVCLGFVPFLGF